MDNKSKVLWVTRTAVLIAMLIGWQMTTAPLGNTLITGSGVNLILIIAGMISGLASGLAVAVISPIMALFTRVVPLQAMIIPFQITGNAVLVIIWFFVGRIETNHEITSRIAAAVIAAAAKFFVLYAGVAKLAVPFFLTDIPSDQAERLTWVFSFPQLFTALTGGAAAVVILQVLSLRKR